MIAGHDCRRCGRPVEHDPELSRDVFESMHWLCFHLEYEHPGDPDLPCDDPSCLHFRIEAYENQLRKLGADPKDVVAEAVARRFSGGD